MNQADIAGIADWTVQRGLAGDDEIALLHGFCERCVAADLGLARGIAIIDTLHPVYVGRVFYWTGDKPLETLVSQYEPTAGSESESGWLNSPFYHLLQSGEDEMRRRLHLGETADFPVLEELRQEGQTDWLAMVQRFDKEASIGEMDCFMSRWTTARPGGFSDPDIAALRRLVPVLGLAVKSASLARVAQSLVEAYLGRDAGRRVLNGLVSRGAAERINAVIWFSDMQGYTRLSETIDSDQLIPLLNDYAEIVITSVHAAGGDVLKLMADGVLAIFTADDPGAACAAALRA
jgi:adenylate cyclase